MSSGNQPSSPATVSQFVGPSHDLTRTPSAAAAQIPLASSAELSAGLNRLDPDDSDNGGRHSIAVQAQPPVAERDTAETLMEGIPHGRSSGNPGNHSGWSLVRSPVRPPAPLSPFEQPPPEKNLTFTAVSDTPVPTRPPCAFGSGPSTGSPPSCCSFAHDIST